MQDKESTTHSAHSRQGIILIIVGLSIASLNGALMKLLTHDLSVIQITWFRFAGFALIILPIVLHRFGRSALGSARPGIQIMRGLSMVAGTIAFVIGVQTVDFADAIAILYAYPFLLILLAVLFLGEKVQWTVWLGVVGGFLGVLLVIRPEFKTINTGTLYVLLSALIVSVQMALNRKLGTLSHPLITLLWGAVVATCVLSLFLPFYWQPVSTDLLWPLGLMIVCGASSQAFIVYSFSKATASSLAPFTYFEIVAAVAIGYFMFGTLPVWISWIGILLITISGLMVARSLPGRNPSQRRPKI
jgi:drug/metabolite transporter (DMT)-like permease